MVAIENAVKDQTGRIDVGRGIDGADQLEKLRRRVGAEHVLRHGAVFQLVDLRNAEVAENEMPLRIEIDVGRLDVAVDQTRRAQIDQRVAEIHAEIDGGELRHGVVVQVFDKRFALLRQKIDVIADGVLLRLDLVAAVSRQIGAAGKRLERFQLLLIIRYDLLIIFLGLLGRRGGTGIDQCVYLRLGFRDGNMLENVNLAALCAPHGIYGGAAAGTDALHDLHVGQQWGNELELGQIVRLLACARSPPRGVWHRPSPGGYTA